jgi:hypothetical protein
VPPRRPRVRRGLSLTATVDSLVIEGAPYRRVLRGQASTTIVPRLLELMNGSRDHVALAGELGVSVGTVSRTITLLAGCGAVEECAPEGVDVSWVPPHLADLLSRAGFAASAQPWEAAANRLARARVQIVGDQCLAAAVHLQAAASLPRAELAPAAVATDARLVVAVDAAPEFAAECWRRRVPLYAVALRGRTGVLGPYVHKGETPCLACLSPAESGPGQPEPADPPGADRSLIAALAAAEIVALVAAATDPILTGARVVDLHDLTERQHVGATRPGCPQCSVVPGPVARLAAPAVRYDALAIRRAMALAVGPTPRHRTWPLSPRADVRPAAPAASLVAMLRELAPPMPLTAYLIARRIPELPPGAYAWLPEPAELARLSDAEPASDRAPASIVVTLDLARAALLHGTAGLREGLLSAGAALRTGVAAGHRAGWLAQPLDHWDDLALAAVTGAEPDREPVAWVADLWRQS